MSARVILGHLAVLAVMFAGFAGLNAWLEDFSWPGVATQTLVTFVALELILRFFGRRDRESSGPG